MTDAALNALLREHKDDYLDKCGTEGGTEDGFVEFVKEAWRRNPKPFLTAILIDVWNEPEPDRWQVLADSACLLDGVPETEAAALRYALTRFPQPQFAVTDDPEGYAVHELLCSLLRNRRGGIVGVSREALFKVLYVFKSHVSPDKQERNGVVGAVAELDRVMHQGRPQLPCDRLVNIYVVDRADKAADCVVPGYGKISAGCGPNVGEDYAVGCAWPVVIKVKLDVPNSQLVQHLRDLADHIEDAGGATFHPGMAGLPDEIPH